MEHYKKYIGQYVKRFYASFDEKSIWKISSYREVSYYDKGAEKMTEPCPEFHYTKFNKDTKRHEEFWTDCEDSCIITNETPILDIDWMANVNHPDYKGYNPFTKTIK
jgi:hypothetical protein